MLNQRKQAQKSVRLLHSYACSHSGHSISPLCTQEILPSIVSTGERCLGSSQREWRIPSLPGQSTPRVGLAACCPQSSVCTRDKKIQSVGRMQTGGKHQLYCWQGGDPTQDLPKVTCTAHSCQKRQLLVIVDGRQQPERKRMHTLVGDVMAQSNLVQNRNLGDFLLFFVF